MATIANKPPKPPRRPQSSYVIKIQGGGRITIPADVRNYFGLLPGKRVRFTIRGKLIYLSKA